MKQKYATFDKSVCPRGMIYCNCRDGNETDEDIARAIDSHTYIKRFNKSEYVCEIGKEIWNDSKTHVICQDNISYIVNIENSVLDMEGRIIPHVYYVRIIGMLL